MRCAYHISVEMQVVERVPPRRHKSPNQLVEDAEFGERKMAKCPVWRCPWVAEVYADRKVSLSTHNRVAIGVGRD